MTFLYPIGLLGLIGVPILIIVYLIKNRYTEQTIASTFLWRLSERFLKRRNPLSRLTGIISLILQLLQMPSGNLVCSEADYSFLLVAFFDAGATSAFVCSVHNRLVLRVWQSGKNPGAGGHGTRVFQLLGLPDRAVQEASFVRAASSGRTSFCLQKP